MKKTKEPKTGNISLKIISLLSLFSYFAAVWTKNTSLYLLNGLAEDIQTSRTLESVTKGFVIAFVGLGLYVTSKLAWRYWPTRSLQKLKKLDERERSIRASIIDWSYRSLGITTVITFAFSNFESTPSRNFGMWMLVGIFFFMPSLVAAHRKGA